MEYSGHPNTRLVHFREARAFEFQTVFSPFDYLSRIQMENPRWHPNRSKPLENRFGN
jgi:hypothetical protein